MKILNEYNILYIKAKIKKTCHIPKFTIIAFIYARQCILNSKLDKNYKLIYFFSKCFN